MLSLWISPSLKSVFSSIRRETPAYFLVLFAWHLYSILSLWDVRWASCKQTKTKNRKWILFPNPLKSPVPLFGVRPLVLQIIIERCVLISIFFSVLRPMLSFICFLSIVSWLCLLFSLIQTVVSSILHRDGLVGMNSPIYVMECCSLSFNYSILLWWIK